jgi:hypothetical protein
MDAMTITQLAFAVIGLLLGVFGYFLKIIHNDIRKATEDIGKLKGQLDMVKQENNLRYQRMEEVTQMKIDHLTEQVTRLAEILGEHYKKETKIK